MKFVIYLLVLILFLIGAIKAHGAWRGVSIFFLAYTLGFGIYTFAVI